MPQFAEIILPLNLARTFTYSVPAGTQGLGPGMRVVVPFGKSKLYTGLVASLHDNAPSLYEAKPVQQILDTHPIVTQTQLAHWFWIAEYYMCSIGDVYRAALPSGFVLESETVLSAGVAVPPEELSDEEYLIWEALQRQSHLKLSEVMDILGKKTVFPVIRALLDKNAIRLDEEVKQGYAPKRVRYVNLHPDFEAAPHLEALLEALQSAKKQRELLLAYFQLRRPGHPQVPVKTLLEHAGSSTAVLKALIDKQIFEERHLNQDRLGTPEPAEGTIVDLNPAQAVALDEIRAQFSQKDVVLLHGVTASGKTEIYCKLIETHLQKGEQVLFLLPEIALTTQLVERLTLYFGEKVGVYHSRFSNNERVELWNRVITRSERAQLVIGARSAVFLPFQNLGLVIVDEEHEASYKQFDPAPRYHSRDAAIVLASAHKAKVLLGSATPSVETYYNAANQKYGLVTLSERYSGAMLPEVECVDLRDKYFRKRMTGHFSDRLVELVQQTLDAGKQVILFQNRRGYSPVVECMSCGHVPHCGNCDVSLTYHRSRNQLRCHYCGSSMAYPTRCHACESTAITSKGFGTEQIELEVAQLFPEVASARMDQDSTRGKYGYERVIEQFSSGAARILVGTQMLAKGLDFSNVGLVGIMNADTMLNQPDFRAFERSFQMLTQVAGRSGRAGERGKVLIQTYNPQHSIILQVIANDFSGMYRDQITERRQFEYPPFFRLVKLTFKHRNFETVNQGAAWMASMLRQHLDIPVLGPEEPPVARVRNQYIKTIVVKIPASRSSSGIKKTIRKMLDSFETIAQFRGIKTAANVDFY